MKSKDKAKKMAKKVKIKIGHQKDGGYVSNPKESHVKFHYGK